MEIFLIRSELRVSQFHRWRVLSFLHCLSHFPFCSLFAKSNRRLSQGRFTLQFTRRRTRAARKVHFDASLSFQIPTFTSAQAIPHAAGDFVYSPPPVFPCTCARHYPRKKYESLPGIMANSASVSGWKSNLSGIGTNRGSITNFDEPFESTPRTEKSQNTRRRRDTVFKMTRRNIRDLAMSDSFSNLTGNPTSSSLGRSATADLFRILSARDCPVLVSIRRQKKWKSGKL